MLEMRNGGLNISTREYYLHNWGFDPAGDRIELKNGWARYEAWMPLEQDPPLAAAGVEIGARVDWKGKKVKNTIVFRREGKEAAVRCTHTVIYSGPAEDALQFAKDVFTFPNFPFTRRKAIITPAEHFVALKSYVTGIAEVGITLFLQGAQELPESALDAPFWGFNSIMQRQVLSALYAVAPNASRALLQNFLVNLLASAPPEWSETRLPYFEKTLDITHVLFLDPQAFTAAKDLAPDRPWDRWARRDLIDWDHLKVMTWLETRRTVWGLKHREIRLPRSVTRKIMWKSIPKLQELYAEKAQFRVAFKSLYHLLLHEQTEGTRFIRYNRSTILFFFFSAFIIPLSVFLGWAIGGTFGNLFGALLGVMVLVIIGITIYRREAEAGNRAWERECAPYWEEERRLEKSEKLSPQPGKMKQFF